MDAAIPLSRWWIFTGLVILAGCQSDGSPGALNARGQAPMDLPPPLVPTPVSSVNVALPLPPVAPSFPVKTMSSSVVPVETSGPVQGFPLNSTAASEPVQGYPISAGPITPASFTTPPGANSTRGMTVNLPRELPAELKKSIPQVKVVAQVGTNNFITDQEVIESVRQRMGEYIEFSGTARTEKEKELYRIELRRLIERELLLDDMYGRLKKNGKSIDEIKELAAQSTDQQLKYIKKQMAVRTEEEFIVRLRAEGLTLPVFRRQLERQMMADEFVQGMLKDLGRNAGFAEIRSYYEKHQDEFKVEDRVRWQDLYISFNNYPNRQAAAAQAEKVSQMAQAGADFVSLIKEQEKAPKGRVNWDGIGTTRQEVPIDVAPMVWSLQPGQISGVIETPGGFHIVKVLERQYAGVRPLDDKVQNECREKLKKQFKEEDRRKMIQELWRKTAIQVFENHAVE